MGDFDLVLSVGDGRLARDANKARDVPSDLSFSTTWQGGFKALDCSLLRSLTDVGTEKPFDQVTLTSQGGAYTAWEGRLQRLPRTVDRRATVAPSALGWATVLEDRQDARALFIDRDLSHWQTPSITRRYEISATAGYAPFDWEQNAGTLRASSSAGWGASAGRQYFASQYMASPLNVARVLWQLDNWGRSDTDWVGELGSVDATGARTATPVTDWFDASLFSPRDYSFTATPGIEVALKNPSTSFTEGERYTTLNTLAVVGDHGLPLTGTSAADAGVKASDALAWLIGEYCPSLTVGTFVDSELGIPHLAFMDPQSPGAIWNAINAYHGWAWGVWEDRTISYNPYGQGQSRTWYVRANDDGVRLQQDGDDAGQLWTDVVVQYTTATGETKTVGPTGTVADDTDDTLALTDPTHPAIAAGNRRVYLMALSVPCILETAVAVGALMLAELNSARRAGSASLKGYVEDAAGKEFPVYMVRGGDQLVITDVADDTPRRVVETSYSHSAREVQLTLDNTLQTVEAILSHLGARTTGRL